MKIFELDEHKLILGDVLEVLSHEIKDNSIDLIFADPPYNIGKSLLFLRVLSAFAVKSFRYNRN
jgi:site-specific DNA-methyltransferase (adenine-specific)